MTLDEAKKLKHGDRVLVEAEVCMAVTDEQHFHITPLNNVAVKVARRGAHDASFWSVDPEAIREKIAPLRKFKEGDIVELGGKSYIVLEDERCGGVKIDYRDSVYSYMILHGSHLKLICAVENREDR